MRVDPAGLAVAIHLREQRLVADPARVIVQAGLCGGRPADVGHGEHVVDVRVVEEAIEVLVRDPVVDRHPRAVAPDQRVPLDAGKLVGISAHQVGDAGIGEGGRREGEGEGDEEGAHHGSVAHSLRSINGNSAPWA